jgi:hypothetical protein
MGVASFTRAQLLEYRESIIPIRQKSQEEMDKQILTLSSAALGLTLTFYKDVLKTQIINYDWMLRAAWVCWIVTIGLVLFSMYLSSESVRLRLKAIDEALKEVGADDEEAELNLTKGALVRGTLRVTNAAVLVIFFLGILAFALVFLLNIK